ncbi:class I SAM-dependent methyltransferase, partial [Aquimarina celericrescens]|nr:class I SAM-dependent methyltransferase [Aquimarina celericrescens]
LIGIDLNEKSLQSAKKMSESYPEIAFFIQNILEIDASKFSCDIIISTLTLHHFDNEQIKEIVQKSFILANKAVIINDLHR